MSMSAKRAFLLISCLLVFFLPQRKAIPCGHDGIYFGGGYEQLFMYTPEHRLGGSSLGRVKFGPGYGANAVVGYDFCGSRWGIQMPFEFSMLRLNGSEWVKQFGSSVEAVLHLVEWKNGLDFRLVGGAGWTYLTEGNINDHTASVDMTGSVGPGLAYYFTRTEKLSAAVVGELPLRVIYYFGDHLSKNGTTVFALPIRISVQVGF
jgi:hypothetical protein